MFEPLRQRLLADASEPPFVPARCPPRACDMGLTGTTRLWLRRLPSGRRPIRLCQLHPRLANRLAWCWADEIIRQQTLADLLEDRRGGRRGFPDVVVRELQRLRDFDGRLGECTARKPWWQTMVKAWHN